MLRLIWARLEKTRTDLGSPTAILFLPLKEGAGTGNQELLYMYLPHLHTLAISPCFIQLCAVLWVNQSGMAKPDESR